MSLIRTMHKITSVIIVCMFLCELCSAQASTRRRQRFRNSQRRDQAELPNGLHQAYMDAFTNDVTTPSPPFRYRDVAQHAGSRPSIVSQNDWHSFTPSTPASNNAECYVEVSTIEYRGGICTQLGGSLQPYICQSGQHFEFNHGCEQIMRRRQPQQQQQQQHQQQQQQPGS